MTTTEQDARALTHLASRLREDTYGANRWDTPGIYAEISRLVGQNLAVTIERVCRHAADPDAKTPGAIRRPYTPGPPQPVRELDVAPVRSRCTTCGRREGDCPADHEFTPWRPRETDLAEVVAEVKAHIHPTVPSQEEASA